MEDAATTVSFSTRTEKETLRKQDSRISETPLKSGLPSRSGRSVIPRGAHGISTQCVTQPLSWCKTACGDVVSWVKFELLHRTHQVGTTQWRAEWFTRWAKEVSESNTVNVISFEEWLSRVVFVAGALEHERPFWDHCTVSWAYMPEGSV